LFDKAISASGNMSQAGKDIQLATGGLMVLANLLGAGGKRKKEKTALGGLLGLGVGAALPGVSLLQGFIGGGVLGGLFADGGSPPMGKISIVGEKGAEFFVPREPGYIVNQEQAARAAASGSSRGTTIVYNTNNQGQRVYKGINPQEARRQSVIDLHNSIYN
jgi:hypothetical protein